jgi:uncharacterized protein (TIGR04255 family)
MSLIDAALPNFSDPPVVEVVCGLQYEGADEWKSPHFGLYWNRIRDEFEGCEEHPPLPQLRLDPEQGDGKIEVPFLPPLRRVFFLKRPGNFLIQIQPYRFLFNWRKVRDSDSYPRFGTPYNGFVNEWRRFRKFAAEEHLGPEPRPKIFELTYINHIFDAGVSFPKDIWSYLAFYGSTPQATTARDATGLALQVVWPLPESLGSLILDMKHGYIGPDKRDLLLLELSARGKASDDSAEMDKWFTVAHDAIVTTFDALTTVEAHTLWGKK